MSFMRSTTALTTAISSAISGLKKHGSVSGRTLKAITTPLNSLRWQLSLRPITPSNAAKIDKALKETVRAAKTSSRVPKFVGVGLFIIAALWSKNWYYKQRHMSTHCNACTQTQTQAFPNENAVSKREQDEKLYIRKLLAHLKTIED